MDPNCFVWPYKKIMNAFYTTLSFHFKLKILCTVGQKKKKHPYLFQYKFSYRNKTNTNHHVLLSTSIWRFKFFLGGLNLTLIFCNVSPQIFQRNRKVHLTNCLEKNFHNISSIRLRVIRRRNYIANASFLGRKVFLLNISGVDEINIFFIRFHSHHQCLAEKSFLLNSRISYNSYV